MAHWERSISRINFSIEKLMGALTRFDGRQKARNTRWNRPSQRNSARPRLKQPRGLRQSLERHDRPRADMGDDFRRGEAAQPSALRQPKAVRQPVEKPGRELVAGAG